MATRKGDNLQNAIHGKGYSWTTGSALASLSATDKKAHLGLRVTDAELKATATAIKATAALTALQAIAAPVSVDWRNKNGNWITPIKDQANCGSCVSFATCATMEARARIACNNANLSIDLSEAHVFYCGCGNCCANGWNFPPALDFCKNTGAGLESSFPYTPSNQPCNSSVVPYLKITNWASILSVPDRKNTLASKGPMVAGMAVYNDFYAYQGGVYRHTTGPLVGYHAISVVGYDDSQSCWICKNSWGPSWGESGFFRIGYGDSGIDTDFAFYDVDVPCPSTPVDRCAEYLPALRRALQIARSNPMLRRCLLHYICGRQPRPNCSASYMNVVNAVRQILQACPQYREPFCRAL